MPVLNVQSVLHKRNATASKVPLAVELTTGELAINTADGKLFTKKASGTVFEIASDKQAALVSGTNIKTINGNSVLGSGDLTVASTGSASTAKSFFMAGW